MRPLSFVHLEHLHDLDEHDPIPRGFSTIAINAPTSANG
jgi:hypothetical protein